MKRSFSFAATPLFALIIILSSCNKNNTAGRYIPATAHAAFHIDLKSLSAKLPWSDIKNTPMPGNTQNIDSPWIKNLLDSPALSGINTDKGLSLFLQRENGGGYVALEGFIKDETAFKTLCGKLGTVTEKDGISYASRFPVCIGWNSDRFVCVLDAPQMQQVDELHRRMQKDSIDISSHAPRDLTLTCAAIFSLEEKKSLAADEKFSSLMKEKGDVHVWLNTEGIYKDMQLPGMFAIMNLEKFYKESIATATINFDNGSIKISAHSYSNKALAKIFEQYSGGKVNDGMLKRLPGKDVAAAFAINFKPEALLEIAKAINLDGIVNGAATLLGFNTNDFIKANKGDIVIGLSDFKMVTDSLSLGETDLHLPVIKPFFNTVFAVSVADTTAFNKLIVSGKKAGAAFGKTDGVPLAYSYNSQYIALGNTQANADDFINAPANNRDFINKISGSPVGGYANLQYFIKAFETLAEKDSSAKKMYDASLKLWDNVLFTGGSYSNGALNYNIEINTLDKNSNTLKQLNQYFALIAEIKKNQNKKEMEDMRAMEDAIPAETEPKGK